MFRARVASVNLAQQTAWAKRRGAVIRWALRDLAASAYVLQECDDDDMAEEFFTGLGWSSGSGAKCWDTDENRNTVGVDPRKWYDVRGQSVSLSDKPGDLGDRHFRSVNWRLVRHIKSGDEVWLGSTHLSNGKDAGPERAAQARVLVENLPVGPLLLGADLNSLPTSEPTRVLEGAGLVSATRGRDLRRSYPAGDVRLDGRHIDSVLARGCRFEGVRMVEPPRVEGVWATDHRAWVGTLVVPGGISPL